MEPYICDIPIVDRFCDICGTRDFLTAHHILPRRHFKGNEVARNRLVPLCNECHKKVEDEVTKADIPVDHRHIEYYITYYTQLYERIKKKITTPEYELVLLARQLETRKGRNKKNKEARADVQREEQQKLKQAKFSKDYYLLYKK